jgi:hypothetical protein
VKVGCHGLLRCTFGCFGNRNTARHKPLLYDILCFKINSFVTDISDTFSVIDYLKRKRCVIPVGNRNYKNYCRCNRGCSSC